MVKKKEHRACLARLGRNRDMASACPRIRAALLVFALAPAAVACSSEDAEEAEESACLEGSPGVWAASGYPAYLDIAESCQVTLFCDLDKMYHTTGYVEGDRIVLNDLAVLEISVAGDTLVLLNASGSSDLPFTRQASADAIPAACRM